MSDTEKEALLAGSSWIEAEFFTGRPDFKRLLEQKYPHLTEEEKQFLKKETEQLCAISNEWSLLRRKKLRPETESFLKKEKFFGLIIPKHYQGREFSPLAHAKVIEKLASHNIPLSTITMVPNALGPAELLLNYGTEKQKNKYLPRLAVGEELPCFGLTEPQAGSDASSISSEGILFKEKNQLKIRLNWNKRWITLSAEATLIGLAVQLKDPDKLYSEKENLGITCLLIPGDSPGIQRGLYHDPMGMPICNAPIKGQNVIVPAEEAIIGGIKQAGKGWKMLMESLSNGRGISIPSLALGCSKRTAWITAAHALVRKQFGLSIGKFEGVEEVLASMAGQTHLMSAVQNYSLSALNQGIHSSVSTALTKYNLTEIGRDITKKSMDIMGGLGLSLGPRNKIASSYILMPIAVTVEGANILTRTLIIFGQGLIKSHPYIYKILQALEQNSLKKFYKNFWALIFQFVCNLVKSLFLSAMIGLLMPFMRLSKKRKYTIKLIWASSLFSFLSDLSFLSLGGRLKTHGKLTGRLADFLSHQYIAVALLWHWQKKGPSEKAWFSAKWGLEYCFAQIQKSLMGIFNNYPLFWGRLLLKPWWAFLKINPIGSPPSDKLGKKLAGWILEDEEFRADLCSNMYIPKEPEDQIQKLLKAHKLSLQENKIIEKIKKETGKKIPPDSALEKNIISPEEHKILKSARQAQWKAIQVDSFTEEEYFGPQK